MRALLLHVPKGFHSEDWRYNYINIMPMGLPAIAHFANDRGHQVRIMNAAVQGSREKALELIFERIRQGGVGVVGLPLHWHFSGFDVCKAAEAIKAEFPHCFVVLGGITASVFAAELLDQCAAIDGVVKGDGELPFCRLLDELDKPVASRTLADVPNLSWRVGRDVVHNAVTYTASSEQLSELDFDPTTVVHDMRDYVGGNSMFEAMAGQAPDFDAETMDKKPFFLNIGRGCSLRCVYCAGSDVMFARYFGRKRLAVRTVESVVRTVQRACEAGFRRFHICFDPPFPGKDEYFVSLFRTIQTTVSPDIMLLFETYNLPSEAFLEAASGFRKSVMIVSPCFFDEKKMPHYKGYSFSREQMEQTLARIGTYPTLDAFVYFAVLPFETWDDATTRENVRYMKHLEEKYGCRASAMPIQAEPGSPWMQFPDLYGCGVEPLGFADFWKEWQKPLNHWSPQLCRMSNVNEVFAEIDRLTRNHTLATGTAFREELRPQTNRSS